MKQLIQNYRTGEIECAEVPIPRCSSNKVLVRNAASLVSIGTERSIIELGKKSLLGKARARPDLVKRFFEKAKQEGILKTFQEALARLDEPLPLGYSCAGVVVEVGDQIHSFSPGDRVACVGAGYASHAEYVSVPAQLCSRIPSEVSFDEAAFGMMGIIALHGVRTSRVMFGETVGVVGLGLLGLLTVQLLKAYGCRVIGMDLDPTKVNLAKQFGGERMYTSADEFKDAVNRVTAGIGLDSVIIAAATTSDQPVHLAVEAVRQRGRIVVVGVADIHPNRNELWHKEVEITVSQAGGPGSFDPYYEERGIDYPPGFVRWTENRNLEEFLRLISEQKIDVKTLVTHRIPVDDGPNIYKELLGGQGILHIGVALQYPTSAPSTVSKDRVIQIRDSSLVKTKTNFVVSVGVVGAGLFGRSILLPALSKVSGVQLHTISTGSSENAYHIAKKLNFSHCTTNYNDILANKNIDAVLIATPHRLHAEMVIAALRAGKHVFVEKPLCVNREELQDIIKVYRETALPKSLQLAVGYNRRFSSHTKRVKEWLAGRKDPLVATYRINAGFVSAEHWVHAQEEGGSRVVGEMCHFVDWLQCMVGSAVIQVFAQRISGNNKTAVNSDNVSITLKFSDGSVGTVIYSSLGDRRFSREYAEFFFDGKVITLEGYRKSSLYHQGRIKKYKTRSQDLGYSDELQHFVDVVTGTITPSHFVHDIFTASEITFAINESLQKMQPIAIAPFLL